MPLPSSQILTIHSNRIGALEKTVDRIDKTVQNHSKTLDNHTRILDEHTQKLDEHTRILNDHTEDLQVIKQTLREHGNRFNVLEEMMEMGFRRMDAGFSELKEMIRALAGV